MSFWGTLGQGLMLIAPFTGPFAITLYVAGASLAYGDMREETRRARNQARDAYNASLRDRMQMVDLQADAPRTLVLGRVRAVEGIRRRWASGTNSERLTLIVSYAGHQIDAFESWYVDDMPVTLDGSGYVQEAPYRKTRSEAANQQLSLVNGSGTFSLSSAYVSGSVVAAYYNVANEATALTVTENGGSSISLSGGPPASTVTAYVYYQASIVTNLLRIRPYLGTSTQNVGSDLAAEYPAELTSTDEFQGIALAVVDLIFDPDAFTSGIPNITAVMRGAKVYDPRLDSTVSGGSGSHRENDPTTWAWSENPALHAHHYARHANGWAVPAAEIETADVMAAATQCDISTSFTLRMPDNSTDSVTLPRHRCGITIPTDIDPRQAMADIMATMGGRWGWAGGTLRMRAAKMGSSVFTLDSSWIAQRLDEQGAPQSGAVVKWTSGVPRQDKINRVSGRCVDPAQRYQVLAFPSVADSTLIAAEGEYPVDVTYSGVNHVAHAQHLASIAIRESQASLRGELSCNVSAWPVELFDVGAVTLSRYGMSAKTFECIGWRWHPTEGVQLKLAEITADIFTVAAELTGRDPAPNSNLPSPWSVETLTGLTIESGTPTLVDGSYLVRARVQWTAVVAQSVRAGGQIEIQWWPTNETPPASGQWPSTTEQGSATQTVINGLRAGAAYVFRVRAVQLVPYVRGNWSIQKQHVMAGAPVLEWGSITERPTLYRLAARGASASGYPLEAGFYNGESGTALFGAGQMWRVLKIDRSSWAVSNVGHYDTLAGSGSGHTDGVAAATAMASALNAIGNDHIVVIFTWDEPSANRFTAGLHTAMYRHGASRAVYGSPLFAYRSAYILVGVGACGEGNGFEAYQGDGASDPDAWCDVSFYVYNGQLVISGTTATPKTLADYSYTGSLAATTTFVQTSAPTATAVGDIWYDSDDGFKQYRWNGSSWVEVRDTGIAAALSNAAAAQATADGKIDSFWQASAPGGASEGDLWFDTDDGYKQYRWTSGAWVVAADTRIGTAIANAATAQSTADGKIVTFVQASAPTATATGDLWFDTDDGHKLYRWSGSAWTAYTFGTSAIAPNASWEGDADKATSGTWTITSGSTYAFVTYPCWSKWINNTGESVTVDFTGAIDVQAGDASYASSLRAMIQWWIGTSDPSDYSSPDGDQVTGYLMDATDWTPITRAGRLTVANGETAYVAARLSLVRGGTDRTIYWKVAETTITARKR